MALDDVTRIPMLADLPVELARRLAAESRVRTLTRGETLFAQESRADTAYFVLAGRMRLVQHTTDGADVTMGIFAPFEAIGVLVVAAEHPYPGSCEALDQSTLLCVPRTTLLELMTAHPPLMMRVIKMLHARLTEANERIRELSVERVERRVARMVLRLANKVGVKEDGGIRIDMPLSRQSLAELTGTTLHSVSRILSEWQRNGLVDTGREQLLILRAHNLVLIAEDLSERSSGS